MVSPNCAVIMESTSTASSYNSIERNAQSELMHNNVGDSMDGLIENELLEEPSQDPDDEDTFSDDSLRLILSSDDEADSSQAGPTKEPAAPCISSEQTTSRDKDMGLTESDETVPFNNEKEALIYKPCEAEPKKESQSSNQGDQILNKTHVDPQKNVNIMWREGNRKEHTSNSTTQSAKRSGRGHSLHGRYNHSTSNIHRIPSYFNNQDNFGRPPGYRKHSSNWKHAKGKHFHSGARNLQKLTVKEGASTPKSKPRTEAVVRTDMSNDFTAHVAKSPSPASFDGVDEGRDITTDKPIKYWPANENCERSEAIHDSSSQDTLPGINNELSRECSHLSLDKESTRGAENSQDRVPEHIEWTGDKKIANFTYDSKFASDDSFDISGASDDKNTQSAEPSSPLLPKDPPTREVSGPTSPIESPAPPNSTSTEQDQTPVDVAPILQTSLIKSLESGKEDESAIGGNLKEAKLDSNNDADRQCGLDRAIETNGLANEAVGKTSEIDDSLHLLKSDCSDVGSSEVCAMVNRKEEMKLLSGGYGNMDKSSESIGGKDNADSSDNNEEPSNEDKIKNGEPTDTKKTDGSLPDIKQVTEEPMDIITQGMNTDRGTGNSSESRKNIVDEISENIESFEEMIQVAKYDNESARIEENEKRQLVCNETSAQSSDKYKRKTTEKSPSEPTGGMYSKMPPLLFLKRGLPDADSTADKLNHKKPKISSDLELNVCPNPVESKILKGSSGDDKASVGAKKGQETPKSLSFVRKLFHRDMKGKLSKLKREELEEFIIQKLVETITMRSEIGKLREQARISEHNQEATRTRCQQLAKQIKDFDMVLDRYNVDRQSNNNKPVPPIKINRSVGLQVNFTTEHGIQSLRALSASNPVKTNPAPSPVTVNGGIVKTVPEKITKPNTTVARRGIKVRSPRRTEIPKGSSLPVQPQTSTATPATLVMTKPTDASHNLSLLNTNTSKEQNLPNFNVAQTAAAAKVQNIVINGKLPSQVNRQTLVSNNQKPESNDLIDLTEEEDKTRSTGGGTAKILPRVGTVTSTMGTKTPLSRFQRVVQTPLSPNVAITTQSTNIRVVQSSVQPTPTALVNNINAARLAYVVQGNPGTGRQILLPPNMNQIRPATSTARGQFSNVAYKSGISTLANGTVRLVTTTAPAVPNLQPPPAPLPDTPVYPVRNGCKLPPPPPSLKISKVAQGIVLSWNMAQSESFADIASYQLYAYQEIPGTPPNTSLWKKVGDVRALPLPMACTLKEFTPGNNYHFAVRAVDTHSRLGQYSTPRNISL